MYYINPRTAATKTNSTAGGATVNLQKLLPSLRVESEMGVPTSYLTLFTYNQRYNRLQVLRIHDTVCPC